MLSSQTYFKENGNRDPMHYDGKEPLAHYFNYESHGFFNFLHSDPEKHKRFDNAMRLQNLMSPPESYNLAERLSGCSEDEYAVVDIGGGMGQALEEIQDRYPSIKGRLLLQDLDGPIEAAKDRLAQRCIETQVHDFFTEQPVKGM